MLIIRYKDVEVFSNGKVNFEYQSVTCDESEVKEMCNEIMVNTFPYSPCVEIYECTQTHKYDYMLNELDDVDALAAEKSQRIKDESIIIANYLRNKSSQCVKHI